jgi:hypothetical protein
MRTHRRVKVRERPTGYDVGLERTWCEMDACVTCCLSSDETMTGWIWIFFVTDFDLQKRNRLSTKNLGRRSIIDMLEIWVGPRVNPILAQLLPEKVDIRTNGIRTIALLWVRVCQTGLEAVLSCIPITWYRCSQSLVSSYRLCKRATTTYLDRSF